VWALGHTVPLILLFILWPYRSFACLIRFLTVLFFLLIFPYLFTFYLSFSLPLGPLCFHTRCHKRQSNLGLLCLFIVRLCIPDEWLFMLSDLVNCISLALLYIFMVVFLSFFISFPCWPTDWLGMT